MYGVCLLPGFCFRLCRQRRRAMWCEWSVSSLFHVFFSVLYIHLSAAWRCDALACGVVAACVAGLLCLYSRDACALLLEDDEEEVKEK